MRWLPLTALLSLLLVHTACRKSTQASCPEGCSSDTLTHQKKFLLLALDGCRWDALQKANTPNLDKILASSKYSASLQSDTTTQNASRWATLLTGVGQAKHQVVDDRFENDALELYSHVYCHLKAHSVCLQLGTIARWEAFSKQLAEPCGQDLACTFKQDRLVKDAAYNHIRDCALDAIIIHFDEIDAAGHTYGFDSSQQQYLQAIEAVDSYCGNLVDLVNERSITNGEEWLVVVTNGQGGDSNGQHHTSSNAPFMLYYKNNLQAAGPLPQTATVDLVPTILHHFEVPVDTLWQLEGSRVVF